MFNSFGLSAFMRIKDKSPTKVFLEPALNKK